jgi:hypothetical protein
MPAASRLDISNLAIAHLPATPIATIDDNSLEARECRRFYPRVVADMLEGPHDWSFANQRVALAALATNDRPSEWLFAYGLPANLGSPIRVLPNFESLGIGLPIPLAGQPYAETWAVTGAYLETPYIIEGTTLYSNVENAVLEFTVNDIAGLSVSQLVITAMGLDLASRLAVPVKKNDQRETKLLTAANAAWERAIADDRNRHPENSGQYVSEAMSVRRGNLTELP